MKSIRVTVSLPERQHEKIQELAGINNLSIAWLIRQAVSEYLEKVDDPQTFSPFSKEITKGKK